MIALVAWPSLLLYLLSVVNTKPIIDEALE